MNQTKPHDVLKILFFSDGNTAVFKKKEQVPELQQSWLTLFAEFLESKGIDPTKHEYTFPNGSRAGIFKIKDGYNWRFK